MPDDAMTMRRSDPAALTNAWKDYRDANPNTRIRDAATALGVSEAELVATGVGKTATRLRPEWKDFIEAMPALGTVMALTRNEYAVHEKIGCYDEVHVNERGGVTLAPDIDLRLFFNRWHHGFALSESTQDGPRRSLQVFDAEGTAVHKIFLKPASDAAAYEALVARFKAEDQSAGMTIAASSKPASERPDSEVDKTGLHQRWLALQDTHDFFPLLRDFKIGRTQAFRLVPDDLARQVPKGSFSRALELAAADGLPIMVFVGSPGCIQIHTGPVSTVKRMGPWQNVLDPTFNLHLREDGIATCWYVRKPTRDGWVTSIELFDAAGQQIAWMFGKRKPGQAEDNAWPNLALRAVAEAA